MRRHWNRLSLLIALFVAAPALSWALDSNAVYAQASPSIGLVIATDAERQPLTLGNGVVIDNAGTILTRLSLLKGADSVSVKFARGRSYRVKQILVHDTSNDLALLQTDATGIAPLKLASQHPRLGEATLVAASEAGLADRNGEALLARIIHGTESVWFYQLSKPVGAWSVGAPVLNGDGEVVGLAAGVTGVSLATPKDAIESLIALASDEDYMAAKQMTEIEYPDPNALAALEMSTSAETLSSSKSRGVASKALIGFGVALFVGGAVEFLTSHDF